MHMQPLHSILVAVCAALAGTNLAAADDFDIARSNRHGMLAGPATFNTSDPAIAAKLNDINTTANTFWQSMETSAGRTELWADLDFPGNDATYSAHMTSTYSRLKAMAIAYQTHGSIYQANSSLRAAILDGLAWMNANIYKSSVSERGNWWDWEIGSPLSLNDTLVLMYDELTPAQISTYVSAIQKFTPSPKGGGANLVWTSHVTALSGVLIKNAARTNAGVVAAPPALNNVTSGEGFYDDNSFLQHITFAYTGAYGADLVSDMVTLITEFKGTQWAYSSTTVDRAAYLLLNAFKPLIYKGETHDSVRGRTIARYNAQAHSGRGSTSTFIRLAASASTADAAELKKAAKYWMQQDTTFAGPSYGFDIDTTVRAESLLADSSITPMAEPTGFFPFPRMDRFVHLRPGWGANLALYSTRVKSFETINIENLRGWHTGDGLLTIYDDDLTQRSDNYWPTVDAYRLDGVTARAATALGSVYNTSNFVGGLKAYGSTYGVAAMKASPSAALSAKKAWFFFDNEIVCLGAEISSTSTASIETTIVNRKLSSTGTNTVTSSNGSSSASPVAEPAPPRVGTSTTSYLHIAGNTANSGLGFYFPTPVTLTVLREKRTHPWTYINGNANTASYTTPFTNNFYTAYLDHGVQPTSASYAYAVLPRSTAASVASFAAAPGFTILANSGAVQAVSEAATASTAAVFWAANQTVGTGTGSIASSGQALVYVIRTGGKTSLTVTDPTQSNSTPFTITLGSSATGTVTTSAQITVNSLSPITVTVNPSGLKGKAAYAQFSY